MSGVVDDCISALIEKIVILEKDMPREVILARREKAYRNIMGCEMPEELKF